MREVSPDELPADLRETYELLKRFDALPLAPRKKVVELIATDYEHLRALKRLSRDTWKVIRPILHRTLRLPGWPEARKFGEDFIHVLPTLKEHCRYLYIELDRLPPTPSLKCSEFLAKLIAGMSKLEGICVATYTRSFDLADLVAVTETLPALYSTDTRSFSLHDRGVTDLACAFFREAAQRAPAQTPMRECSLTCVDLDRCYPRREQREVIRKLSLFSIHGGLRQHEMPSRLVHLTIGLAQNQTVERILEMLRACAETLEHLCVRAALSVPQNPLYEPVLLPRLHRLSISATRQHHTKHDKYSSEIGWHLHQQLLAPALQHLGLAELCETASSDCIAAIVSWRSGGAEPRICTRGASVATQDTLAGADFSNRAKLLDPEVYDAFFVEGRPSTIAAVARAWRDTNAV